MPEVLGDAVHVWLYRVDKAPDPAVLARCAAVLDASETARWQRYHFERDRHLFLVAHGLLRHTLSRYADVPPERWRFTLGAHGRPELAEPPPGSDVPSDLRFNLSHTQGLVAVLVNRGLDCGVDVEVVGREVDVPSLARHSFHAVECADVMAQAPSERQARFFAYWTLKEAYIKARGMGLALPLGAFAMRLGESVSVAFEPPLEDDAAHWQFQLLRPTAQHQLALAIKRGVAADREVVVREVAL